MNVIKSENHWRVSHSGYSIKCGWSDNARIICQYPGSSAPGKLDGTRFEQWLKDAEHICELHNAALTPPPVVEVTDETAYELHQALHNARSEYIRKTPDPLPWYWDMAAWIYAVQQVLGHAHPLALREPTDEECEMVWIAYQAPDEHSPLDAGRAMFNAVREVLK